MARFRAWFSRLSDAFTPDPSLPNEVAPSERISRFVLSKHQFKSSAGKIKHNAFMPPTSGGLSVYRTQELNEDDIWSIGTDYVAAPQGKTVYARGDLLAGQILGAKLGIESVPRPHPRHADIVGWPQEKDEQKMCAVELANAATLRLPPNS